MKNAELKMESEKPEMIWANDRKPFLDEEGHDHPVFAKNRHPIDDHEKLRKTLLRIGMRFSAACALMFLFFAVRAIWHEAGFLAINNHLVVAFFHIFQLYIFWRLR